MTARQLLHELRRYERLLIRAVEAYDVGDYDELGHCLRNFGEAFDGLLEAVESEGVSS